MARKHAAAKGQVRKGLVAAVATVIRAGDAVTAATTGPRNAIRNLLSRARKGAARAPQARPGRARKVSATGGAHEGQAIKVAAKTSAREVTSPRKRRKSHRQRTPSRRRPASPGRRGRRS